MYDKILALLTTKFAGVRKDGLEQMARAYALQCSTEEEAKAIVEKITEKQAEEFAKDYRRGVDKEVSTAKETIEANYKKKYETGKEGEEPTKTKTTQTGEEGKGQPNIEAIVSEAIAKAIAPLQQELSSYKTREIAKTRQQQLEDKLKGCKDETFKAQTLKDFARMQFEDDNAFAEYLTEKETDIGKANQAVADQRLGGGAYTPILSERNDAGVSTAVASYLESVKPEANTAFKGKEV